MYMNCLYMCLRHQIVVGPGFTLSATLVVLPLGASFLAQTFCSSPTMQVPVGFTLALLSVQLSGKRPQYHVCVCPLMILIA